MRLHIGALPTHVVLHARVAIFRDPLGRNALLLIISTRKAKSVTSTSKTPHFPAPSDPVVVDATTLSNPLCPPIVHQLPLSAHVPFSKSR